MRDTDDTLVTRLLLPAAAGEEPRQPAEVLCCRKAANSEDILFMSYTIGGGGIREVWCVVPGASRIREGKGR